MISFCTGLGRSSSAFVGAEDLPRQASGFPRLPALRTSSGHLAPEFAEALLADRQLVEAVIAELLDSHFVEGLFNGMKHPQVDAVEGHLRQVEQLPQGAGPGRVHTFLTIGQWVITVITSPLSGTK